MFVFFSWFGLVGFFDVVVKCFEGCGCDCDDIFYYVIDYWSWEVGLVDLDWGGGCEIDD